MLLKFCEISDAYIIYLHNIDNRVPLPKKANQVNNRKYIGTILTINDIDYFVNLSSFKNAKHSSMKENIDFLKIGTLCVLNLNNMIPVPKDEIIDININNEDLLYKKLLLAERRIIISRKVEIFKNANDLYKYKMKNGEATPLAQRCCDFMLLEESMKVWETMKPLPTNSKTTV